MDALGVHPAAWPLPLTKAGIEAAEKSPTPQPVPQLPSVKREAGEPGGAKRRVAGGGSSGGSNGGGSISVELERMGELELWQYMEEGERRRCGEGEVWPQQGQELHSARGGRD